MGLPSESLPSSAPWLELAAGLVRATLTGTPANRASYLSGILVGSRAFMRICLRIGTVVFPHLDPDAIASAIRAGAGNALEELASHAGVDGAKRELLMLALEMGLDWPDAPGRDLVVSELDGSPVSCARMAAMLEDIRSLEAFGLTPDAIRSTILKAFGLAADGSGMTEMTKETFLAENHRLIDALLKSQPGAS